MDLNNPNIPILGQTPTIGNDPTRTLDVHDSEILEIEALLKQLRTRATGRVDLDSFQREAKEKFYNIGWEVDIRWYDTDQRDVYIPEVVLMGRSNKQFVFDRDRQVHEVVNDILETGEGGVIKTSAADFKALEAHHRH